MGKGEDWIRFGGSSFQVKGAWLHCNCNCKNTQPFINQPTVDGSQSGLESTSSLTTLNSPPISHDSENVEFQ